MQRLNSVNPDAAEGRTKELLSAAERVFGVVPNTATVMANSPAVLESWLAFNQAMEDASIGERLQNQIFLSTSESNSSDYCKSILCAVAPNFGLTAADILAGRTGNSEDRRTNGALKFAEAVLENGGKVSDEQLDAVRQAGFNDAEIVEVAASVVLSCLANFLNNVADTDLDFDRVEPVAPCTASTCAAGATAPGQRPTDDGGILPVH